MSFAASFLRDALGIPSTKVPVDVTTFVSYIIPPVVGYFVAAVLAITPQTRAARVALCPIATLLAFRAAVSVDLSLGNPKQRFFDMDLMLAMLYIAVHTITWTLDKKPLVRYLRATKSSPSTIMDALDLATNLRGHGWEWSRGLYVPRETRPTNRIVFALYALLSAVAHGCICGVLHLAIQTCILSTNERPTIFDETLPYFVRYLRSSIISTLAAFAIYTVLQMTYDLFIVPAVLLFGQDPAQWPPAFDSPWCATSLNEFWGRRWHQWFRHTFLLSAYPFSVVLGRTGTVIGAFLSSGIYHHIMMVTFDSQSEMWRMVVPFGMMAPGVFAEWMFYRLTGRKVGGVFGWVWTMAWLILWGNVIVDGFARAGFFAFPSIIGSHSPVRVVVEKLVADFDAWSRTT